MADEKVEFKYRAEYAKSSRSSCKGCKTPIEKGVLRLAILVQSSHFDGKIPNWYHHACFFNKQKPKDSGDIESFESLKWDDQEKIRKNIAECSSSGAPLAASGKKPSKRAIKQAASKGAKDFCIEYAKSSRAMCRGCEVKIAKGEVRISKKDYESEDAVRYGGKDLWHHVECFSKLRNDLQYFESGEFLPGFLSLTGDDQKFVINALPLLDKVTVKEEIEGEPSIKKIKKEDDVEIKKVLEKQNKLIYKYKDMLKDMKRNELQELLAYNKQQDRSSPESRMEHIAECMAFGALLPCENCKTGQFVFKSGVGYQCRGDLTEWVKCLKIEKTPQRKPFKIPKSFFENYPALKKIKFTVSERKIFFKDVPAPIIIKKEEPSEDNVDAGPKVERFAPLRNLSFYIIGRLTQNKEKLKQTIVKLGGSLTSSFNPEMLTAVISTEDAVEACKGKMMDAKTAGIHVLPESFIEEATKDKSDISALITKMAISPWGTNLESRIKAANLKSAALKSDKSKSIYTKSVPTKQTFKIKNGLAVDPDSQLEDETSVYADKKNGPYNVVLSRTDVQSGHNSYYKMQLLMNDHSSVLNKRYYLFRSWGRIGTTIGGKKTDKFSNLDDAKHDFFAHYREKTKNEFDEKDNFVKKPGCYYPVDITYGDETDSLELLKSDIPSKLHTSIQQLVTLLFDIEMMKKVMMEFELDLEKMPLGKLSKKQIQQAYSVLSELQMKDGDIKPAIVIDATNRFYTLIPHSFGVGNPPLLDNKEIINSKVEMLASLVEIETAYSILKHNKDDNDGDDINPIDKHYSKLNTHIEIIDKDSEEFVLINTYLKNTHGETHTMYDLEIIDLFKVKRQGEEKRFKPFKKLHNRKLLWHGSRLTNFAGILSQGLRIAPPEAPVTGYMFGKGIYFADMVSKSANYCMTSRGNDTGLLLLCEVALGDMYERTHAEYVEKLPSGKHSTKGLGVTSPNPEDLVKLDDGLEVPVGKGVKVLEQKSTSLLYNEYIVYDPAQVKARYLLKTKFNYKY